MAKRQTIKQYNSMLQRYIDNKRYVIINRIICDKEENLSGFIVGMSKHFLFLQLDYDFLLDGYAIIRLDDFDSLRHSSYEQTQRKIFKGEGLLENGVGFDKHLPLTNWTEILKALKKYDYHIVVQSINKDYLDFWIGEIKSVTDKSTIIPMGCLMTNPGILSLTL